jgi:hypothetical protein
MVRGMVEKLSESQKSIKKDILRRMNSELRDAGLVLRTMVVEVVTEEKIKKMKDVEEYLEERTERTENERDILTVGELFEGYENWQKKKYDFNEHKKKVQETYITTTKEMGEYMTALEYPKFIGKVNGKTVRGYRTLRWNTDTTIVNEFMKKFTIRTESTEERISVENLLRVYKMYCEQKEQPKKINETEFRNKLRKYDYKAKAAVEKPYYIREMDGKKVRNTTDEIKHCITKLKWLPGAVESLESEVN